MEGYPYGGIYVSLLLSANAHLELARRYSVNAWLEPAILAVLQEPPSSFTLEDARAIGFVAYHRLMTLMWEIDAHRKAMVAVVPPARTYLGCGGDGCAKAWVTAWWSGFARHLLHPDAPISEGAARDMLLQLDSIPGMCDSCLRETVFSVCSTGAFSKEKGLINDAVRDLLEWQGIDITTTF